MVELPQLLDWIDRVFVILNHMGLVCSVEVLTCVLVRAPIPYQAHPVEWSSTSVTGKAEPMENETEHMKCTTGGASPAALVSAVILLLPFFCLSDLL